MAKNSMFAVLLRSHWGLSLAIALGLGLVAAAVLPADYRVVGAMSGLPFAIISALAAWRQWKLPSAARIEQTHAAVSAMAWPEFSQLLEQAFVRDGYSVQRGKAERSDFLLERQGRRMVVSARRWKSARTGIEPLQGLVAARDDAEAPDALCIALGEFSDKARAFATANRIAVWQAAEIAYALRGMPLKR